MTTLEEQPPEASPNLATLERIYDDHLPALAIMGDLASWRSGVSVAKTLTATLATEQLFSE